MNKITFVIIFLFVSILPAQNVVQINWESEVNSSVASPTIEVGDTVKWVWTDASSKSVTSSSESKEMFDSEVVKGPYKFSHTFTQPGTNEYQNYLNPSMKGTVTVVQKLSVEDKFLKNLSFYPNPVKNDLTLFSLYNLDEYRIYNVLGSLVAEGKGTGNYTQIDMSRMNSGMYFVQVSSKNLQATLKIAKK